MLFTHPPLPLEWLQRPALKLDLGRGNRALESVQVDDPAALAAWIQQQVHNAGCEWAYGGYGEDRAIYAMSPIFGSAENRRSVHLGVDLWLPAGTPVFAMAPGKIHSFAENAAKGDYGPTIILEHETANGSAIHCLYGHLARSSLASLGRNQTVEAGQRIGWLGEPHENVGWAPHLHLQLIHDIGAHRGDYPGVCTVEGAQEALANCPSPEPMLEAWMKG